MNAMEKHSLEIFRPLTVQGTFMSQGAGDMKIRKYTVVLTRAARVGEVPASSLGFETGEINLKIP
jgi:hypothetical protein